MADPNEIAALKASFRGALSSAETLASLKERIEQISADADVSGELLEDLIRLSGANTVAAAALRGLVETMAGRRSAS